jgi:hypothetical protein
MLVFLSYFFLSFCVAFSCAPVDLIPTRMSIPGLRPLSQGVYEQLNLAEEPEKPDCHPHSMLIQLRHEMREEDLVARGVHLSTTDVDQSDIMSRRSPFDSGSGHS